MSFHKFKEARHIVFSFLPKVFLVGCVTIFSSSTLMAKTKDYLGVSSQDRMVLVANPTFASGNLSTAFCRRLKAGKVTSVRHYGSVFCDAKRVNALKARLANELEPTLKKFSRYGLVKNSADVERLTTKVIGRDAQIKALFENFTGLGKSLWTIVPVSLAETAISYKKQHVEYYSIRVGVALTVMEVNADSSDASRILFSSQNFYQHDICFNPEKRGQRGDHCTLAEPIGQSDRLNAAITAYEKAFWDSLSKDGVRWSLGAATKLDRIMEPAAHAQRKPFAGIAMIDAVDISSPRLKKAFALPMQGRKAAANRQHCGKDRHCADVFGLLASVVASTLSEIGENVLPPFDFTSYASAGSTAKGILNNFSLGFDSGGLEDRLTLAWDLETSKRVARLHNPISIRVSMPSAITAEKMLEGGYKQLSIPSVCMNLSIGEGTISLRGSQPIEHLSGRKLPETLIQPLYVSATEAAVKEWLNNDIRDKQKRKKLKKRSKKKVASDRKKNLKRVKQQIDRLKEGQKIIGYRACGFG